MRSAHHADEPVPFESNLTLFCLEQVLELRRRLRGRVVDLDLAALDEVRGDLLPVRVELGVVDRAFLDLR